MGANSLSLKSSRLALSLLACVSVLALNACSTSDRYAFWRSNSGADQPDLRNMPNNTDGDNKARAKLGGLQQQMMADHAAAIAALQTQGAPTITVLSSAQDLRPLPQTNANLVAQQPLAPPPLPVKLPVKLPNKPAYQPTTPVVQNLPAALPAPIAAVTEKAVAPPVAVAATKETVAVETPKAPAFVPQKPVIQNAPQLAWSGQPVLPATLGEAPRTNPVVPQVVAAKAVAPQPFMPPVPVIKNLPQKAAVAQSLPPITEETNLPPAQTLNAPTPIAESVTDNSVDINLDALDSFGAPTSLVPNASQAALNRAVPPALAPAQQPYAYGFSNYAIKQDLFNNQQGGFVQPYDDSVIINPILEAAPTMGSAGEPMAAMPYNNAPTTGMLGQVPFANNASRLGPQGHKTVASIAAAWQQAPQKLSLMAFASGLGSSAANQNLANARANAVKQQLVALGVPAADIRIAPNPALASATPRVDVLADSN